jgi:hypothetical protein
MQRREEWEKMDGGMMKWDDIHGTSERLSNL